MREKRGGRKEEREGENYREGIRVLSFSLRILDITCSEPRERKEKKRKRKGKERKKEGTRAERWRSRKTVHSIALHALWRGSPQEKKKKKKEGEKERKGGKDGQWRDSCSIF